MEIKHECRGGGREKICGIYHCKIETCKKCGGRIITRLPPEQPYLGLATTKQLLEELWARIELDQKLDYRTVDND